MKRFDAGGPFGDSIRLDTDIDENMIDEEIVSFNVAQTSSLGRNFPLSNALMF